MAIKKRFTQLNSSGSNHKIIDAESAYVTGSFQVGPGLLPGTDTNFFVSGNIGGHTAGQPGVGVFGGDLVVSGNLVFEGTISGNIPGAYFYSTTNSVVESSGSLYVSGTMRSLSLSASNGAEISGSTVFAGAGGVAVGSDASFFVSGAAGNNSGNKAVFGGTTFTSGNIQIPFDTKLQSRNSASNDFADLIQLGDGSGLGLQNNTVIFGDTDQTTGFAFLQLGGPAPVGLIALITGSNEGFFSGSYKFHDGLSGSLQALPNGLPYLISGPNITITTNSLGQVAITGSAGATSPQYWFSTVSNETYTTGSVLLRPGLAASPTPSLIQFDVSGSVLQISDGSGGFLTLNGAFIQVKDVPVADAAWDPYSGSLNIYAANVYASGAGSSVTIIGGNGGWDDVTARAGGTAYLYGGTGGSTVGLPTAGDGGSVIIAGGLPGWSGGAYGIGEEGKAGNVYINGGLINSVSRSLSGSDLFIGDGGSNGFRYIGFDDPSNYHLTFEQDTYFFVSGAIGAKGTTNRGVAVFGGDLHVSGGLTVDNSAKFFGGLSGSLTKLVDGSDYLVAGPNITISTNSLGQIEITGSATTVPEYFYSLTNDVIESSGSLYVSGAIWSSFLSSSNGIEVTGSAFFNDNVTLGASVSDIIIVNGQLTASAGLEITGSSTFAAGSTFTFNGNGVFAGGLTGSLQEVSAGVPYLLAGDYITIATNSLGQIEVSASNLPGTEVYWTSDVANNIYTTGSAVISSSLSVNPSGTGRGLLRVGGLDIGPITGSGYIYPDGILPGNILSASNGVFDGTWGAVVRHEFHILGIGVDGGGTINQFAATYLVMSAIGYDGIQRVRSVTELSRETSGSYAENWDVNVAEDCSIEITSSVGGTGARWYAQRVKEMAININGDITA